MDILHGEQGCFHWGGFTLDPTRRALSHNGTRIKLPERLFDVLLHLVTNHGRVVDRDELLEKVWAGRTVEENNVGQAIFELRRALRVDGNTEPSIMTVPGRGFRFAEQVTLETLPAAKATGELTQPATKPTSRRGSSTPLGVALLALLATGVQPDDLGKPDGTPRHRAATRDVLRAACALRRGARLRQSERRPEPDLCLRRIIRAADRCTDPDRRG